MAFGRLSRLGREKFQKIVNELTRGTPAQTVARLVHQWGDAQDVREETLAKQLKRLHTAITNGAFGGDLAQQAKEKATVRIMWLHLNYARNDPPATVFAFAVWPLHDPAIRLIPACLTSC